MIIRMSRRYWQRLLFKIRTFGVKFEIFDKLYNWFSIWIISKWNFRLLIFVWLDMIIIFYKQNYVD